MRGLWLITFWRKRSLSLSGKQVKTVTFPWWNPNTKRNFHDLVLWVQNNFCPGLAICKAGYKEHQGCKSNLLRGTFVGSERSFTFFLVCREKGSYFQPKLQERQFSQRRESQMFHLSRWSVLNLGTVWRKSFSSDLPQMYLSFWTKWGEAKKNCFTIFFSKLKLRCQMKMATSNICGTVPKNTQMKCFKSGRLLYCFK